MTRHTLRQLISDAVQIQFGLELQPTVTRAPVELADWTSNAPLQLARSAGRDAGEIGHTLRDWIAPRFAGRIDVVGGRLNFHMNDDFLRATFERSEREGAHFGAGETLSSQRILVEFVSADPTGPLSFVSGRHAAVGEAICRLLENQGARVTREFYLNDATSSSKIRALGEGVAHWYLEAFGRAGDPIERDANEPFVRGIAAELARRDGAKWLDVSEEERLAVGSQAALESATTAQKTTLERFGVRFDQWVSENDLAGEGRVELTLNRLKEQGFTYERDGALWLQTSRFGDESDRVLTRSNGAPTYFAGDIAYHLWKGERGFERIITIWGAEHRPYIARTKAALQAAGCELERFEFLICEGATLQRDGATLRLGSGGGALLLDEELAEIGADALKFGFLRVETAKVAAIELEIAHRDDETNPAYAAQLLPSRLARLARETQGQISATPAAPSDGAIEWSEGERELARLVALWPDEAAEAALRREPARVARFILEMSAATRVLLQKSAPSVAPLPQRLQLLRAAGNAAQGALKMLGIEGREKF
jgi:arginyl-tRNA synthetase